MIYHQGKFEIVADARALPRSPVLSVAQTADGSIWQGTRDAGLFRTLQGRTSPVAGDLPDQKVNCMISGAKGDLWVGTDEGSVQWNGSRLLARGVPGRVQVLAMAKDRDGNIWLGTDARGLLRLNGYGVFPLDPPADQSHEAVTAVYEDREGDLWTGSANGIERLRDSAFATYSRPEGLPADGSKPLFVDSGNRVWFAPAAGGLWWMKDGQRGRVGNDGLGRDVVYSIAGGKDGLWLGRQNGGLTRLRMGPRSFTSRTYTKADGLAQESVFSVYQTRDGSVWAGTLSGGVSKLGGDRFITYTTASGLVSNTVAAILEDAAGTMWFATPEGLGALSQGRWQAYFAKDGLPSNNVYCLLADSTGVLWTGTAAGLAFRTPRGFQVPAGAPPALREPILGLEEDRHGSLWVATSSHVLRVNRGQLMQGTLGETDLREYGLADGLRGVEGVKRNRSVVSDPSGRIWFSLNRGISVVDPGRITQTAAPTIVHIQTVSADGTSVRLQQPIHIPGGQRRITFAYAGLSLSVPERVRFRYRLDGFDSHWSEPVDTRDAVFTNLPPRGYRFRVIASSPDGAWNSNEDAIALEVDPLFRQTWWFRGCAALAGVSAILAFYRLRMRQLTGRLQVRFDERLAERTRIAQELHDTLLQGFLSASMQVYVASESLPADSKAKAILNRAGDLMRKITDEGRNAVRGLRASSSVSLDLERALSAVHQEFALAGNGPEAIEFRIVVDGEQKPLHPLLRDEVYRIGREALINSIRHARAQKIEVELTYSLRRLRVQVRDDGCGIDPQILQAGRDGHWGLPGMRERADQIGARLRVYSRVGVGTEVDLSVPGHIAYQGNRGWGLPWFGKPIRIQRDAQPRERGETIATREAAPERENRQ